MHKGKDLGQKTFRSRHLPGQDIAVDTVQIDDPLIVFQITATVAGRVDIQKHVIGAGGTNPIQPAVMTQAELQAAVDGFRQIVADNAAWHAAMDVIAPQIT